MTMLTVPVQDDELATLAEAANRLGLTTEQYAHLVLTQQLKQPAASDEMNMDTFRAVMAESKREFDELYRRLAQ